MTTFSLLIGTVRISSSSRWGRNPAGRSADTRRDKARHGCGRADTSTSCRPPVGERYDGRRCEAVGSASLTSVSIKFLSILLAFATSRCYTCTRQNCSTLPSGCPRLLGPRGHRRERGVRGWALWPSELGRTGNRVTRYGPCESRFGEPQVTTIRRSGALRFRLLSGRQFPCWSGARKRVDRSRVDGLALK